jgi:hypothetical protein
MRVLLIDADSANGFPNLALMKLSAWRKAKGDSIDLIRGIPESLPLLEYGLGYASCVFFQNRDRLLKYISQLPFHLLLGGSGYNMSVKLASEIEHMRPDYELYPTPFSLGFTSRGCIRHCSFCIVPDKEGIINDSAPISEFHDPKHDKVILLDNNFGASPRWRENVGYLQEHGLKVNFNQGLDIRLMTEEFARALADLKYYNWTFKTRGLHFAFDSMGVENAIIKGIEILDSVGIPRKRLMFYILTGYDTTPEEDLYRVKKVAELGAVPYVMCYNRTKGKHDLARWANRRYYQFIPYENYVKVAEK